MTVYVLLAIAAVWCEVLPRKDAPGQVRVAGIDPCVHDSDDDTLAEAVLVSFGDVEEPQMPLSVANWVRDSRRDKDECRNRPHEHASDQTLG